MSCGVGHRHSLDPALLWLWPRLPAAALIRPLAWELPYATGLALKRPKKKKKENPFIKINLLKSWWDETRKLSKDIFNSVRVIQVHKSNWPTSSYCCYWNKTKWNSLLMQSNLNGSSPVRLALFLVSRSSYKCVCFKCTLAYERSWEVLQYIVLRYLSYFLEHRILFSPNTASHTVSAVWNTFRIWTLP